VCLQGAGVTACQDIYVVKVEVVLDDGFDGVWVLSFGPEFRPRAQLPGVGL